MAEPLVKVVQALPAGILEAASASKTQIHAAKTVRPPLLNRLAALYYGLSFGLYMYIWIVLIALCARFPSVLVPVVL